LNELLQHVEELKKNLTQLNSAGNKIPFRHPVQNGFSGAARESMPSFQEVKSKTSSFVGSQMKREKPPSVSESKIFEGSPPSHPNSEASFQEINVRWEELLQAIRKERIGVWSQLINLKPLGIRNGWLMLGAPNDIVVGMTKPYKNYLQDTIQKVLGMRVAIDFMLVANEQPVESDEDDPLIKYLKDEFGAEPVE